MVIELYMFKPGARSTPKLRRNQSSFKYATNNASIDSFTSLRPNSPGLQLAQTMPNSPVSFGSHFSIPEWQTMEPPSPAYSRFPDPKETMAAAATIQKSKRKPNKAAPPVPKVPALFAQARVPVPSLFEAESPTTTSVPQRNAADVRDEGFHDPLAPLSSKPDTDEHAVQAVLDLHLPPNSVALIRRKNDELGTTQIYDWKGNEISYTFGGIEHFQSMYDKEEDGIESRKGKEKGGAWKRMKGWSRKMKQSMSKRETKTYEIQVWRRKLKN